MIINYGRVRFVGSALVGIVIALAPTTLLYKLGTGEPGVVIFFFPAAILATRLVPWTWKRSAEEQADAARRRHEAGRPPLGE